jgi:hypothetical protein
MRWIHLTLGALAAPARPPALASAVPGIKSEPMEPRTYPALPAPVSMNAAFYTKK